MQGQAEDGREIRAIPLLEALEAAECPGAAIRSPVQVRLYQHRRYVWIRLRCNLNVF